MAAEFDHQSTPAREHQAGSRRRATRVDGAREGDVDGPRDRDTLFSAAGRAANLADALALADGPTEVHKDTVARQLLRQYKPADGLWPSEFLPPKREAAREKLARLIDLEVAEL